MTLAEQLGLIEWLAKRILFPLRVASTTKSEKYATEKLNISKENDSNMAVVEFCYTSYTMESGYFPWEQGSVGQNSISTIFLLTL
jgi:hypothetical protein